jgi:hypothetical protein
MTNTDKQPEKAADQFLADKDLVVVNQVLRLAADRKIPLNDPMWDVLRIVEAGALIGQTIPKQIDAAAQKFVIQVNKNLADAAKIEQLTFSNDLQKSVGNLLALQQAANTTTSASVNALSAKIAQADKDLKTNLERSTQVWLAHLNEQFANLLANASAELFGQISDQADQAAAGFKDQQTKFAGTIKELGETASASTTELKRVVGAAGRKVDGMLDAAESKLSKMALDTVQTSKVAIYKNSLFIGAAAVVVVLAFGGGWLLGAQQPEKIAAAVVAVGQAKTPSSK